MSSRQEEKERARAEREARERAATAAETRRRRLVQLAAVIGLAALVVVVLVALSQSGGEDEPAGGGTTVTGAAETRAMLAGMPQDGPSLGSPRAPVVLTEFADPQCPFCAQYARDVLPQIIERYVRPGRLRLELRLLRFLGPDSRRAASAAQATATRDRLWQFIDVLYDNQGRENSGYVTDAFLGRVARAAGVPPRLVLDPADDAAIERRLRRAESEAQAAGVNSTPSFVIGPQAGQGKPLTVGSLDIGAFAAAIEPELRR